MDIYSIITEKIIASLEGGVIPWRKPWVSGLPSNYITEKPYSGINLLLLGMPQYSSPYWLTFKQVDKLGGSVNKGEKGSFIVYYTFVNKTDSIVDDDGEQLFNLKSYPVLKYYKVWNWEQTTGLPEKKLHEFDTTYLDNCDDLVRNIIDKPVIKTGGKACYQPSTDYIFMPDIKSFLSSEEYYSTLFHELTHWTGHHSRLNREGLKKIAFGSECYSKEELVAEMGASFLCGVSGISGKVIDNSTAYIQSWLKVIKGDKKFILSAAAQAQKAVDFILNRQSSDE